MSLQDLLAQKAGLEAELEKVNAAIEAYGDKTPVRIASKRNFKNTVRMARSPGDYGLAIFADEEFTHFAKGSDDIGYVPKQEWEAFKLTPEYNPRSSY